MIGTWFACDFQGEFVPSHGSFTLAAIETSAGYAPAQNAARQSIYRVLEQRNWSIAPFVQVSDLVNRLVANQAGRRNHSF